ncbi:MAG: phage/plasmid primase, P4 family [Oscillospiraceae bacterium]
MNINLIKQRINCIDYAQRIGVKVDKIGCRCVSPLRNGASNKNSFVVYEDFFYDFGASQGGDVVDFCALYEFDGDRGQAIKRLADITGVLEDDTQYKKWVKYTQNLNNAVQKWHEALTQADRDYLHSRRITDETIDRLKLGNMNDRIVIPYFKNGYVCYYTSRGENPKYKKAKIDGLNENIPWGMHTIDRNSELLVIAEGCFDAISFDQENYAVLATCGGHFNKEQLSTVKSICKNFNKVFICFDNDEQGEEFKFNLSHFLYTNKIDFIVGEVPKGFKDVSEYYADGRSLDQLIADAEKGIIYLCKRLSTKEEIKDFVYSVSKYFDKLETIDVFDAIRKYCEIDSRWLTELEKSCGKPPREELIAKEVTKNHDLKYNPKIGFFEYNGKFWKQVSEDRIKGYIGTAYGIHRTGGRCNSVLHLIKSDTETDEIFNRKPIINFINGTLDLELKISFREHSATDLCTYVLDYPYNPESKSTLWENYIATVTDNDELKANLLQESSGYVLFPDNRLQKCFVLIGSGANGKSVFLNVITKIFGYSNVSNVEMSSLAKDFNAINLMSSMLNISAETKTNVSGAESVFKQIVAGDAITDSFKGKDRISFIPRAKMFIACNEYMKSKDTTDGWIRRFCFVNFPLKFCESPQYDNERPMDKDIEFKLTETDQLSGIFNWVLQGYKQLKVTGYFTEPKDHSQIQEEFKETTNPLIIFVKELKVSNEIFNDSLYDQYKHWCEDCGHKAMSKNSLLKRTPKLIKEYRKDLKVTENGYGKVILNDDELAF